VFLIVLTVRVELPDPPDDSVTDVGLSVAARPCLTRGLIAPERLTVPVKPLRLVREMRDIAEDPARIVRLVGCAVMRKSGVALPVKLAVWTFSGTTTPAFTTTTVEKPIFAVEALRTL
jgi:hypothetical protein